MTQLALTAADVAAVHGPDDFARSVAEVYALHARGAADAARNLLDALAASRSQEPAVYRARAWLAQTDGDLPLMVESLRKAVQLAPQSGVVQLELAHALLTQGDIDQALDAYAGAAELRPDDAETWFRFGMACYQARRDEEALVPLGRAHRLAPGRPDVARALAETAFVLDFFDEALPLFLRLSAQSPGDVALGIRIARCRSRLGDPQGALEALERFAPTAEVWQARAQLEEDMGDVDAAMHAYRAAHALRPEWADPVGGIVMLQRAAADPEMIEQATQLLRGSVLPEAERAYLGYALGKVHDARGEYAAAADCWHNANTARRHECGGLDRIALRRRCDETIRVFTRTKLDKARASGSGEERPVFVVGMPRSGTTLVEQLLASHPQAHGCGELTVLVRMAQRLALLGSAGTEDFVEEASSLVGELAREYTDVAAARAGGAPLRLVDKQPYNFFHLGLAGLVFPRARAIWCRRDPRDVALSIYSENFAPQSTFATDLSDIAFLIEMHEKLMRHWQRVAPLSIIEIDYESLTSQFETQAKRLVDFVGLDWNPACLDFHTNSRPVQTLSKWQVRQPIHSRSVGRWRNYPQWFPEAAADKRAT